MSNLQNLLEIELKKLDNKLYDTAKLQEIILFIKSIKLNIIDIDNYEIYFNRKCLRDYKFSLLHEIIKKLDNKLYNKKNNEFKKLKLYKILFLFQSKLDNNTLEKFLKKNVDTEQLLKNNKKHNSLRKQLDINKEIKNKKEVESINKEKTILEKNIISFIAESIKDLDYSSKINILVDDYKNFNNNLKNIIDYFLLNSDIINKLQISDMDYLDLLIQQISSNTLKSFDVLNDTSLIKLDIENDLLFLIKQYKHLEENDFKSLMNNLLEIDEEGSLDINNLENIIQENIQNLGVYIFIHILKECDIQYNEIYIDYLKDIYTSINKQKLYQDIILKSNSYNDLMDYPKYIFENSLEKFKQNKKLVNILNDVLNYYINNDISKEEFETLNKDINILSKIIKNKDNSYDILDNYINNILDRQINQLVEFDLVLNENENIKDLEKKLKKDFFYDDIYIKKQLQLYDNLFKDSIKKSNHIYIHSPKTFKDFLIIEIFLKYYEWTDKANKINQIFTKQKKIGQKIQDKKSYKIDIDIKNHIDDIFQNILSNIFQHYLKSIQVYLDKEDNDDYRQLFYYYDEEKKIKVYTDNVIEELLIYVRDNLKSRVQSDNKLLKFLTHKVHYFLFNHKFYSIIHEKEIIFFDIMKYDKTILVNLKNIFSQVNEQLQINRLKQVNINKINKEIEIFLENDTEALYEDNINNKTYIKIKEINDQENVLSEKQMKFLGYYFHNEIFEFLKKTIKSGEGIVINKSGLEFIKLLINILVEQSKEKYSFNILKDNISNAEYKKTNEIQKELNRLLKTEFKIISTSVSYTPPTIITTSNIRGEIDDKATYQSNDVGYIELERFKKYLKDDEQKKIEYNSMVVNLVKLNFKNLNTIFQLDLQENDTKKIIDLFLNNNLKINGIKGKLLYKMKLNNLLIEKNNSNSIVQDMIKELTILYFIDILTASNSIKDINNMINSSIITDETLSKSIINKNILSKKQKKIGKVLEKINEQTYKVKFGNKIKNINKKDFIIVDSLKNKMVRIIKGVYKGELGIIKEYKVYKYLSKKEKKNKKEYLQLKKDILSNNLELIVKIKNANINQIILDDEFNKIQKYRTKLIKNMMKLKQNEENSTKLTYIKLNKKLKKILSVEEKLMLEKNRFERIQVLKYSNKNLKDEIKLLKNKSQKNYHIRIHIGDVNEKDIFLTKNDIKFDITDIEKDELLDIFVKPKNINFDNLYDIIKYLFNNTGNFLNYDLDITKTEYYHTIYKNMIKILNEQKKIDINKIKAFKYQNNILKQLNDMDEKIKNKLKTKKSKKLLEKLSKNKNKINITQNKISKMETDIKQINKNSNELLQINEDKMKEEKIQTKILLKIQEEKQNEEKLSISNKLISECVDIFDNFINSINNNILNCDILKELSNIDEDKKKKFKEDIDVEDIDDEDSDDEDSDDEDIDLDEILGDIEKVIEEDEERKERIIKKTQDLKIRKKYMEKFDIEMEKLRKKKQDGTIDNDTFQKERAKLIEIREKNIKDTIDGKPIWEIEGREPTWLELNEMDEDDSEDEDEDKKSLMFGDSFVRFFTLYKDDNIKPTAFSGKTMKGISKPDDKDAQKIIDIVSKTDVDYIFFNFGQVDLHLSYYYKTHFKGEVMDFEDIVEKYVKFIKDIKTDAEKIIIDVYPSALDEKDIYKSVKKYLGKDVAKKIFESEGIQEDIKFEKRLNRYKQFNKLLEKHSKKNGIEFLEFKDILLTKQGKIKQEFLDIDSTNIHIRWEPFIQAVDKSGIMEEYGFRTEYLGDLEAEEIKYLKEKRKRMQHRDLDTPILIEEEDELPESEDELPDSDDDIEEI